MSILPKVLDLVCPALPEQIQAQSSVNDWQILTQSQWQKVENQPVLKSPWWGVQSFACYCNLNNSEFRHVFFPEIWKWIQLHSFTLKIKKKQLIFPQSQTHNRHTKTTWNRTSLGMRESVVYFKTEKRKRKHSFKGKLIVIQYISTLVVWKVQGCL